MAKYRILFFCLLLFIPSLVLDIDKSIQGFLQQRGVIILVIDKIIRQIQTLLDFQESLIEATYNLRILHIHDQILR